MSRAQRDNAAARKATGVRAEPVAIFLLTQPGITSPLEARPQEQWENPLLGFISGLENAEAEVPLCVLVLLPSVRSAAKP